MTRSMTRWMFAGRMALAALGTVAVFGAAPAADAALDDVSSASDPVGDANFSAPAFQDVVFVQMTRTADGDFDLLMEMAGPVPAAPPMPPPANTEITWSWNFDLDPTTFPAGYPYFRARGPAEFSVGVSWNGVEFAGTAVDRRPLLTGGEAILSPVEFSIDGTIVRAHLAGAAIGDVPSSFAWFAGTGAWSGPVGSSEGHHLVDVAVFSP